MNLIAENLLYKPDEQFHLNEVSFNFKKEIFILFLAELYQAKLHY